MLDSNQFFSGGEDGFYDHPINQSLRFNDNDSAYLSWTPASAGNRKTGTFSCWVKRANIGVYTTLFDVNSATSGTVGFHCRFDSVDRIDIQVEDGTNSYGVYTSAKYRDPSAWYHVVVVLDTTQATAADRLKLYVNGEQPALTTGFGSPPAQNANTFLSDTRQHNIGVRQRNTTLFDLYADAYITEVHFIDGQALDPDNFGETKSGVWIPKEYDGSYGTNGFYLPMSETTQADGFSAVTYQGNGAVQSINNVGFSPDLVWIKERNGTSDHVLFDSVRGTTKRLRSNKTNAEDTVSNSITSFDADGFTTGADASQNESASFNYVAWCWDAGTGSAASNTDGSITSSVKANTDYGFSIVSWTGTGANATVGHGLSSAPEMIITKGRSVSTNWPTYHEALGASASIRLNSTSASLGSVWNNTAPTSSVFSIDGSLDINGSSEDYIAYCFHSVTGYSKFGSYSGTGAAGNTVTTGFRPAFVMVKRTDSAQNWVMWDNARDGDETITTRSFANLNAAEATASGTNDIKFTDTGFTVVSTHGEVNASGGTYIYMAFADTKDAAFYYDGSGNKNNWTPAALTGTDVVPDSPTNNFATWNSIDTDAATIAEGSLKVDMTTGAIGITRATMGVESGKWYWETTVTGSNRRQMLGIALTSLPVTSNPASTSGIIATYGNSGNIYYNGSNQGAYMATYDTGDIVGIAFDADAGTITYYKNGTSQGVGYSSIPSGVYSPFFGDPSSSYATGVIANFGQDSSFAGNKTPQGNTDDNGIGDFYYAPPSGYLALCTANLPEPEFSPADDESPQDHFNTVLYTGNGSTQSITGVGFQSDFTWIKGRNSTRKHMLQDAVRGAGYNLWSHLTDAEVYSANWITSFDSDGFGVGTGNDVNQDTYTYVAWNWKANGAGVANTDGTISSTVSANTEAGFSIVSWEGTGATATVGHGLDSAPELIIIKNRDDGARSWHVLTSDSTPATTSTTFSLDSGTNRLSLNLTVGYSPYSMDDQTNGSSEKHIAYCFHSVDGFSKFGSYTGNGSSDGPFVYTGFRPAFVIIKRTSATGNWQILDNKRDPENADPHKYLYTNLSNAEGSTTTADYDFLSNGFKPRNTTTDMNASGSTYIYMAFAENPFKYSNAR